MPELPEVQTIASELSRKITGKKIKRLISRSTKLTQKTADKLTGRTILTVSRRAKILHLTLDRGLNIIIHLKMTGRLFYTKKGARAIDTPYVRAFFNFSDGSALVFEDVRRFGYIKILSDKETETVISSYGPEPLLKTFTLERFKAILSRYKSARIKQLLMDQTKIAGIGNIYADESLFKARVHPLARAGGINPAKVRDLYRAIKFVLNKAIRLGGSSIESYLRTDGTEGKYDKVRYVYQKKGEKCPNGCGGEIKKIKVGGRGTYFCPECQKV